MSRQFSRFLMATLKPPLEVIRFVIETTYKALFGRHDIKLSKQHEDDLVQDLRQDLGFLIDQGGRIFSDTTLKHPRAFDYAVVIIGVGAIFFRFLRGRGELRVQVAYEHPGDWSELPWLLGILGVPGWETLRPFASLKEVGDTLRGSMGRIREAFSDAQRRETEHQLSDMHQRERLVAKQLEIETNRRLYREP